MNDVRGRRLYAGNDGDCCGHSSGRGGPYGKPSLILAVVFVPVGLTWPICELLGVESMSHDSDVSRLLAFVAELLHAQRLWRLGDVLTMSSSPLFQ